MRLTTYRRARLVGMCHAKPLLVGRSLSLTFQSHESKLRPWALTAMPGLTMKHRAPQRDTCLQKSLTKLQAWLCRVKLG